MSNRLSLTAACAICGIDFHPRYVRKGVLSRHCSKRCAYKAREVQRECRTCGRSFTTNLVSRRTDYCSMACIARSPCLLCGTIITGRATFQGGARRFCSKRCAAIVNRGTKEGKGNYVTRGLALAIKRQGYLCCEHCRFADAAALDVHHKNHDHSDNRDVNLITLCANCHAVVHRAGSANLPRRVALAHYLARL